MKREEIIDFINSEAYEDTFVREFWQVFFSHLHLRDMIEVCKTTDTILDVKILEEQSKIMEEYINILVVRAEAEGIDVNAKLDEMMLGMASVEQVKS